MIEQISDLYADHFGDEYRLVAVRACSLPLFEVNIIGEYTAETPMPAVQHFTLKAIEAGVINGVKLANWLGVEDPIALEVLKGLRFAGAIQGRSTDAAVNMDGHPTAEMPPIDVDWTVTQRGLDMLAKQQTPRTEHFKQFVRVCGLTGKPFEGVFNKPVKTDDELDYFRVKPHIAHPRESSWNTPIQGQSTWAHVLHETLAERNEKNKGQDGEPLVWHLKQLVRETIKSYKKERTAFFAFFQHTTQCGEDQVLVLNEYGKPDFSIQDALPELLQRSTDIIPWERKEKDDQEVLPEQLALIHEEADVPNLADRALIPMASHRYILSYALKHATERLIINSPWGRNAVIKKDFKKNLEEALRKGISVTIYYGMQGPDTQQNQQTKNNKHRRVKPDLDKPTIKYFDKLKKHNNFKTHQLTGNHTKVLIWDNEWAVVTSFNWLSFMGDPKLGVRHEIGTVHRQKNKIAQLANHLANRNP